MQTITLAPPNFLALHRAEQALARPDVRLDDLVAVFTNSDASGGLLLYNAQQASPLPAELLDNGWNATVLAAVQPSDYTRFDGPVLTLAAIDALLDDIPSHGTYFFPLDRLNLFGRDSIDPMMRATIGNLIRTIWERWRALPEAEREAQAALSGKRIVQLSLPLALQHHHETDLVALRFDLSRLATLTDVEQLAQPVFNRPGDASDIQSLAALGDHEWVAGFKEIPLLVPELNRHRARLLLFRPALRRFTTGARMRATCTGMAYRCWHAWQHTDEQLFREAAYCLAAEAWLEGQDVTDVVAILPDEEFEIFADQGVAHFVSRGSTTQIQSLTDHVSLESVLQSNTAVPRGPVLAIPVLARALCQRGASVVFDLGPILWQAERAEDLARTFWLLSRDLLIPPGPLWLQLEATPGEIADLAQRAALIYGLSNPWGWRQGRYSLLVSECYDHLDRCLERLAAAAQGTPLAFYYAALRAWYGCPFSEEIQSNLARAVEYGRIFMLMCEDSGISGDLAHEVTTAASLIEAADRLAPQDGQTAPRESKFASVAEMLRGLAKHGEPVPIPSQMFGYWSDALMEADRDWQRLQSTATEQRPNSARLDDLQEKLDKWQRRAFAPYHELQALLTGLRTKSEQVRRLQQAVGDQPVIRIVLRTTEVELGSRQTIAFEIHNNGNQTASSFVWSLRRFSGFDLVSPLPTPQPIEIGPGERRLFDIQARASAPALVLVFSYRYRDKAGRLFTGEDQTTLQARNEPLGVRMRINPFEVGRPVAGASFFNRTTEINRILTRLAKGNTHPLVLRGPRRIGKSSLMRRIVELLHQPADAKAYGLPSELQAALHNLHPIEASLQTMDRSLPRPFEAFLNGILEDMCRNLAIDDEPITVAFHRAANQSGLQRAFAEQVDILLSLRPNEHTVVLLDELDEVFRTDSRDIAIQLRNIIESETRISWIAASTMLVKASVGKYGSPWFNLLEPIEMRNMDWASAYQLVLRLGKRVGFDWTESAVTAILELSGRRPYLMQLLGVRTTDGLNILGRSRVESSDVSAAVNQLVGEISLTGTYLGFVWNEAQWLGKLMLWHILNAADPLRAVDLERRVRQLMTKQGMALNNDRFYAAFDERLAWLTDIADALEIDSGNHVIFSIPLVKRYLERVVQREQDFLRRATAGLEAELKE